MPIASERFGRQVLSELALPGGQRADARGGGEQSSGELGASAASCASTIRMRAVEPDLVCSIPSGRPCSLRPARRDFGEHVSFRRRRVWQPTIRSRARTHSPSTRPTGSGAGTHRDPKAGFVTCQSLVASIGRDLVRWCSGTGITRVVTAWINPRPRARFTSASGDSKRARRNRDAWYWRCSTAVAWST